MLQLNDEIRDLLMHTNKDLDEEEVRRANNLELKEQG